jgi:hypothetical protein
MMAATGPSFIRGGLQSPQDKEKNLQKYCSFDSSSVTNNMNYEAGVIIYG